jgi:hypothetical protein
MYPDASHVRGEDVLEIIGGGSPLHMGAAGDFHLGGAGCPAEGDEEGLKKERDGPGRADIHLHPLRGIDLPGTKCDFGGPRFGPFEFPVADPRDGFDAPEVLGAEARPATFLSYAVEMDRLARNGRQPHGGSDYLAASFEI